MIKQAYMDGIRAAAERFGVREASLYDLLQYPLHHLPELAASAATTSAVRALKGLGKDVARVAAPKTYQAIAQPLARAGEVAAQPARTLRQRLLPNVLQKTPEDLLARALSAEPSAVRNPLRPAGAFVRSGE